MRPKRKKDIIPILAQEKGWKEKDIDGAVSVYWEEVSAHMTGLKTLDIKIDGMGSLCFARKRLEELEAGILRYMDRHPEEAIREKLAREYQQIQLLKQERQKQYDKRAETQQRKLDYQTKKALDQQMENPGGSVVQSSDSKDQSDPLGLKGSKTP